jgi:hypothetical protein
MFTVKAGHQALAIIRDEGLKPERIRVVAGAAGGPKWLVLYHLDRLLLSGFFNGHTGPLHFIGSSIGAWRFAALCQEDALSALGGLRDAYIAQSYDAVPTPADVSAESRRIMDAYLPDAAIDSILRHPTRRLHLLAVQCRHFVAADQKGIMSIGLAAAVLANLISRRLLQHHFKRTVFTDPRNRPPLDLNDAIPFQSFALEHANFKDALLASGSIPLVMSGVRNPSGAAPGVYRDGGMVDYHLDLPYRLAEEELVLMPHYTGKIVPGWLDKKMRWRHPARQNMARVVLISPAAEFVRTLPGGKIPDRTDFKTFFRKDTERIAMWQQVVEMCRPMAEAFMEQVSSGRIRQSVQPLDFV